MKTIIKYFDVIIILWKQPMNKVIKIREYIFDYESIKIEILYYLIIYITKNLDQNLFLRSDQFRIPQNIILILNYLIFQEPPNMELIKSVFAYDNSFLLQFNLIFSNLIFNDSSLAIPQTQGSSISNDQSPNSLQKTRIRRF